MTKLSLRSFQEIDEVAETDQEITYFVQLRRKPSCCPHCDANAKMYKLGQSKTQWVKDVPQGDRRVKLLVYRNRYQCSSCGVQFWERMSDVDPKRKMTKRLVAFIPEEAQNSLVAPTSKKLGICQGTIRQVCRDAMTDEEYNDLMERGFQTSGRRKPKD